MIPDQIRQSRDAMIAALRDAGGDVLANGNVRCPFHDDQSPSASIKLLDLGHWHFQCFSACQWGGDVFDVIQRARGCGLPEAKEAAMAMMGNTPVPSKQARQPMVFPSPEVAAESYAKFKGGMVEKLYVWSDDWVRARIKLPPKPGKDKPEKAYLELTRSAGGWIQKAPPKPHCLYRVNELRPDGTVGVCEGEKATDAAWWLGIQAVTSGSSSSAGHADWKALAGRNVAIFRDNDEPGLKYALEVAGILAALNPPAQVKIITLPGLPPGGDLVEFIQERRA